MTFKRYRLSPTERTTVINHRSISESARKASERARSSTMGAMRAAYRRAASAMAASLPVRSGCGVRTSFVQGEATYTHHLSLRVPPVPPHSVTSTHRSPGAAYIGGAAKVRRCRLNIHISLTPCLKRLCFNFMKVNCFQAIGFKYQPAPLHQGHLFDTSPRSAVG